jgi:hypothetical protein
MPQAETIVRALPLCESLKFSSRPVFGGLRFMNLPRYAAQVPKAIPGSWFPIPNLTMVTDLSCGSTLI